MCSSASCLLFAFFIVLLCGLLQATSGREHLEGEIDDYTSPYSNQQFQADFNLPSIDMIDMDFSDNFFSSLNQPFVFPSPRDLGLSLLA